VLQSSSTLTAKPCLSRLHFFFGDVESQALRLVWWMRRR
jgi:hypothetical protein